MLFSNRAKNIALALLILFGLSPVLSASEHEAAARAELLLLDRRVDKAFLEKDVAFMADLLAEEFTWVHGGGYPVDSKATALKSIAAGARLLQRDNMDVRVYGDAAIVAGSTDVIVNSKILARFHMQRTYVKKEEAWKMVYQHVTLDLGKENRGEILQYIIQNYWAE